MISRTRVTNVDGQIIALTKEGVRTFLLPDPQGSVVGEIDSAQKVVNRTTYWPFGEVRTGTGYPFGFVGTLGYHRHRHAGSFWTDPRMYVRARWLHAPLARWLTQDPLWPMVAAYQYRPGPTTKPKPGPISWPWPAPPDPNGKYPAPKPSPKPRPTPDPHRLPPADPLLPILKPLLVIALLLLPCSAGPMKTTYYVYVLEPVPKKPADEEECDRLYHEYKDKDCKHKGEDVTGPSHASGRCPPPDPTWVDVYLKCARARYRYWANCDRPGSGAKKPNPCLHAAIMCRVFKYASDCVQGPDQVISEFPQPDLSGIRRWCEHLKTQCQKVGTSGNDWWPTW